MLADVRQLLSDVAAFPQTPQFTLAEPFDLAKPLHRFGGGVDAPGLIEWPNLWQAYLTSVGNIYEAVKDYPKVIGVVLIKGLADAPCDQHSLQGKDPKRPFVCQKAQKGLDGTTQDYVLVMPASVGPLLVGLAAQSGAKGAWEVASVAVALLYAQYLRLVYQTTIGWPNGPLMDYCVAGISLRGALLKGSLSAQGMNGTMAALDNLYEVPKDTTHDIRTRALMRGFETGKLPDCTNPY